MKRYCNYDAIVHYKVEAFASQNADSLKGKLKLVERDALKSWEAESFLDSKYETYISRKSIVIYAIQQAIINGKWQIVTQDRRLCGTCYCTGFSDYIFVNDIGELIKPNFVSRHFALIVQKHNLKKLR